MREEITAQRVGRDQRVDCILHLLQALQAARIQSLDLFQHHPMRRAEVRGIDHRLAQFRHQLLLVLDRALVVLASAVDRQRLLQRGKHVGVVHDDTTVLAGEHAIGPGYGLHQRVVAHRLVQIHRRATGCVEAGQPHGADEDQAQGVFGILELLVHARLRFAHAPAVRFDLQAQRLHLLDLVLPG